ncbi:MAG: HNH endonuclease [Paludibacteraceae bacterium]|nr:HNH endonuclease [Paludibacteraceae bacterium]
MNPSIFPTKIYDGVPLRLVPHAPDNGYLFYVSDDGKIGLRIAPNGKQAIVNATTDTTPNSKYNANRKQRYLTFRHPWNDNEQILVSHAVYRAWSGKPVPLYHQIHHLNGITTDNRFDNLLCVLFREHRSIADVRQRDIQAAVPNGDLTRVSFDVLRRLQDPRVLSDDEFPAELQTLNVEHNLKNT